MSLDVKIYDNGDHTCIVWSQAIANPFLVVAVLLFKASARVPARR